MGGRAAVLAVAGVVDHQHAPVVGAVAGSWHSSRTRRSLTTSGSQADSGQEPLQPLDLAVLRTGDRLGAGQRGQGLVAVPRLQQAPQVVTEPAALRHACPAAGRTAPRRPPAGRARVGRGGGRSSVAPGGGWWDNRTAQAYPRLNKLPLLSFVLRWWCFPVPSPPSQLSTPSPNLSLPTPPPPSSAGLFIWMGASPPFISIERRASERDEDAILRWVALSGRVKGRPNRPGSSSSTNRPLADPTSPPVTPGTTPICGTASLEEGLHGGPLGSAPPLAS